MIDVKVSCLDSVVQAAKQVGVKTVFACFGVERPVPVEEVAVVVHQPGHALVLQYTYKHKLSLSKNNSKGGVTLMATLTPHYCWLPCCGVAPDSV